MGWDVDWGAGVGVRPGMSGTVTDWLPIWVEMVGGGGGAAATCDLGERRWVSTSRIEGIRGPLTPLSDRPYRIEGFRGI